MSQVNFWSINITIGSLPCAAQAGNMSQSMFYLAISVAFYLYRFMIC